MTLVAVREYDVDGFNCRDTLHRSGTSFALRLSGGNEPESWQVISAEYARQWLGEAPEQLVFVGNL